MILFVFVVGYALLAVALWMINDAADAAATVHRTMDPILVWLLLIPIFQVFWNFKAFPAVSDSLAATLRDKGRNPDDCGRTIGIAWAVLVVIIWVLHIVAWGAGGEAMSAIGFLLLVAWVALLATAVGYVIKVQGAKSEILSGGSTAP